MSLTPLFYPESLLLISDDKNFENFVLRSYKRQVIEKEVRKRFDLLVADLSGKELLETIRSVGKYAKTILITQPIKDQTKKKILLWSKRNKKPVINAKIYIPLVFDSIDSGVEKPKKGSTGVITQSRYTDFWLDVLSREGLGISFFISLLSDLHLDELLNYVSKSKETERFLIHLKDSYPLKTHKRVFDASQYSQLEELIIDIHVSTFPEIKKNAFLVITNGYTFLDYKGETLSKSLQTKIKRYLTKQPKTNIVDIGLNSTAETLKKLIKSVSEDFDLFVIVFNPYFQPKYEEFLYGLAVLRSEGVPLLAYVPGGNRAVEIIKKLREFSIPAFNKWYEVKETLEKLGLKV